MKRIIQNISLDYENDDNPVEEQADSRINRLEEKIVDLEEELRHTKGCLRKSIAEYKTSSEELQLVNEELIASNEELQNTNEEYQSVNEELHRLNAQYQERIQELADLNNDKDNFFSNTNIGTVFLDANLCIRWFTPSITKEINLKEHDIGRLLQDISHNLDNDELYEIAVAVMSSLIPSDKEVRSKNGCWYLLKCAPCLTPENSCKGVIILLLDITRRKRAEIGHAKIGDMYEKLVEYSPYAIFIIQNGKFHFSNSAGLKLLNVKRENELTLIPFGYFFSVDEEKLIDYGENSIQNQGNTLVPIEDKIILADGNELLVEISAIPILVDGKPAKLLFVRDITFRMEQERLREENEKSKKLLNETILSETLKTEFFSNLSHELRTPLNVILSALQLLELYSKDSDIHNIEIKLKRYIKIMKQNCYRQLRLVNNMIDITKLDAGFFELNPQNCDIVNIVENITLSVSEYIKNKSIELIFNTDIKECITACDPDKIERVVLNLLSNSVKFTRQGGIITVSMYCKGENIVISIKDTGIGIPPDKLNIVFDRFRQVDKSLTRKQEGSGIGLSIVKSLVELHGGKVSLFSEYGKGTELMIEFPIMVLTEDNSVYKVIEDESQERIERIHIEFSDIYSFV